MRRQAYDLNLIKRVKTSMRKYLRAMSVAGFFIGLAGTAVGQEATEREKTARRLESVTWNPSEHKLTWTVSKGVLESGKFVGKDRTIYEIDMASAIMVLQGEERKFSKREAVSVHALMDLVAKYAAESTMWWDAGNGDPVNGDKQKVDDESDKDEPSFVPERPGRPTRTEKSIPISTEKRGVPVIRIVHRTTAE